MQLPHCYAVTCDIEAMCSTVLYLFMKSAEILCKSIFNMSLRYRCIFGCCIFIAREYRYAYYTGKTNAIFKISKFPPLHTVIVSFDRSYNFTVSKSNPALTKH